MLPEVRNILILVCICLAILVYVLYVLNQTQTGDKTTANQIKALQQSITTNSTNVDAVRQTADKATLDLTALKTQLTAVAAKPIQYGIGNLQYVVNSADYRLTAAQMLNGGLFIRAPQNGQYVLYLPSAVDVFNACGGIPYASFRFVFYLTHSMGIRVPDGCVLYAGVLGNNDGYSAGGATGTQGGVSFNVPNNSCYTLNVFTESTTKYYVFMSQ
jgi:hypothetical protein